MCGQLLRSEAQQLARPQLRHPYSYREAQSIHERGRLAQFIINYRPVGALSLLYRNALPLFAAETCVSGRNPDNHDASRDKTSTPEAPTPPNGPRQKAQSTERKANRSAEGRNKTSSKNEDAKSPLPQTPTNTEEILRTVAPGPHEAPGSYHCQICASPRLPTHALYTGSPPTKGSKTGDRNRLARYFKHRQTQDMGSTLRRGRSSAPISPPPRTPSTAMSKTPANSGAKLSLTNRDAVSLPTLDAQ